MRLSRTAVAPVLWVAARVGVGVALVTVVAVNCFGTYGASLFLGVPFAAGAVATLLHGRGRPLRFLEALTVTMVTACLAGLVLLLTGSEGLVCIVMSLPICLPMVCLGGLVANRVRLDLTQAMSEIKISAAAFLPLCLALTLEALADRQPDLREVTTRVEIEADAMTVWETVVAFPPMEAARSFPFSWGIAYPTAATIDGQGVGALRRCEFNTGAFVEPITAWEEGRLLEFDVTSSPPPLIETSLYGALDLPHLHGTFEALRGRFHLEPREDGRVILTGTTWYRQKLWPQFYWNPIADELVHRIHRRVLLHIQEQAEDR